MVFSSLLFLFRFLPCVLVIYLIAPGCFKNTWKNLVLFLASLVFYAWGEPVYIVLMLFSTVVDYINGGLAGYFINRNKKNAAKFFVFLSAVINLSLLGVFKYAGFATGIWNGISGMDIKVKELALPIGISFYTFQTMSYTIDIYRGEAEPEKNIINFGAYVALFPQLIAGPVVRYGEIEKEIYSRKLSSENTALGFQKFITGLGKKVIFANQAGALWEEISTVTASGNSVLLAWLGAIAYTFQIYFDFSGYSDMAAGIGQMLGFHFPANFNYPYQSKSITEFWRRWHISLSTWFKEYVYIPLGGSRKGFLRQTLNLFIVWTLTGLWHGAAWNFVIWGIYFFILLFIEKCFLLKLLDKIPKILCHLYAMFFIICGWVIFACEDLNSLGSYLKTMAGTGVPLINNYAMYKLYTNILLLLIMAVCSTKLPVYVLGKLAGRLKLNEIAGFWIKAVFTFIILITSMALLISGSYNPFLYFRF